MRKVVKYEADDGTLFNTEEGARAYDELAVLANWYEVHKLYGRCDGCKIEWEDLVSWLKKHKEQVTKILKGV